MTPIERLPVPLLLWYRENARTLPWRSDPTPYHVLVSEIMLQQTRVSAVLDYYARFLDALPDVRALAEADGDTLLKLWQGLGYYNRARNLQRAARVIVRDFGGVFPGDYETLLTLPGVGEYTAGAIASIAFGEPVPAVDGNVLRVLARLTGDDTDIRSIPLRRQYRTALLDVIPRDMPGTFNQALMELGAIVCLPNGTPLCDRCPAAEFCRAHSEDRTDSLPVRSRARARRVEERVVFLLFHGDRIALRRRPERGLLAGLWEYPNELSPAEDALSRWDIRATLTPVGQGKHIFTHVEWHMTALTGETETDALPEGWQWADSRALRREFAVPSAFQAFTPYVTSVIGEGSL